MNLQEMSDDELMAAWDAAGEELEVAKNKVAAFAVEHQRREGLALAERKAANLSQEELALLQTVQPEGIESGEEFGHNG